MRLLVPMWLAWELELAEMIPSHALVHQFCAPASLPRVGRWVQKVLKLPNFLTHLCFAAFIQKLQFLPSIFPAHCIITFCLPKSLVPDLNRYGRP